MIVIAGLLVGYVFYLLLADLFKDGKVYRREK